MTDDIANRSVFSAGFISFVGIVLARSIQFISSLCMIAYLSPREIGEFAYAMFVLLALFSFLTTGTDSRIISMESSESYLPESWTIELIRGISIFLIMTGIFAYFFYNQSSSQAHNYMVLLGISMLIRCARNINMVTSRKKLNMMPIFYIELGSAICMFLTSLLWVMIYKNGWALAIGYFLGSVTYTYLSYFLLPRDGCKVQLNLTKVREIFSYSKWIFFGAQIVSFFENIIPLFVSHMFGIKILGLFEKSDLYSRKVLGQINQVFWIVGLPWASRSSVKHIHTYHLISIIMVPFVLLASSILVALAIFIPLLLIKVGGASWSGSGDIVRALCFLSAASALNMTFGIVLQAIKLPKFQFLASLTKLIAFFCIFLYSDYENIVEFIYTLVWADIISTCSYFVFFAYYIDKRIGLLLKDVLILCLPYLVFHLYGYDWITQYDFSLKVNFVILFFLTNLLICALFTSLKDIIWVKIKDKFHNF